MLAFACYLLKVTVCSGVLYGYYLICLRNKIFHRWNRFYLLASVILSLTVPLIKINIWQNPDSPTTRVIQLIQVVNNSDEFIFEYPGGKGNYQVDASKVSFLFYILICVILSALFIHTLLTIYRLKKGNRHTMVGDINFINTNAKGTPFSFFNNIFWNDNIDLNTSTGKQIFQHELAHVHERHSYDKVFMNTVLIFCWCNPFFWLIRKELNMIHEFIADQKAVEDNDTAAFAAMILQATYPANHFNITNNFFYSPLKRRLIMLTKNRNSKISYVSRLLVLPLAALIFFAFTLKMKTNNFAGYHLDKKITVVIDAGHGGNDNGAESINGIYEKNLTLSIAKKIRDLNDDKNVTIVLSRDKDETLTPPQRVDLTKSKHADLFISIHLDAEQGKKTNGGCSILIPQNDNIFLKQSRLLGFNISESFKNNYQLPIANSLQQRSKGVWILRANSCPSVIIEPGFISSQTDLDYLMNDQNQQTVAKNILNGIEKYARENFSNGNTSGINDTVNFNKDIKNTPLIGANVIDTKNHIWLHADTTIYITQPDKMILNFSKIMVIVNGNIENHTILSTKTIISKKLTVYSGDDKEVLKLYGENAKAGVLVFSNARIINKQPYYLDEPFANSTPKKSDKIFTKVEKEAEFPGGRPAWLRYLTKIFQTNLEDLTADTNNIGTCTVQFIVYANGNVSDVKAISMKNSTLARVGIKLIKEGPKWEPARQDGHAVDSYKKQPITFTFKEENTADNNERK